jgi:RNA polymerase sigma-70 factor (ECF subfamily)
MPPPSPRPAIAGPLSHESRESRHSLDSPDEPDPAQPGDREESYREVVARFGAALERIAFAFEFDRERRRDLLQEIHVAIWRSLSTFDGRCSLRTWIHRVAHNVAASHVIGDRRDRLKQTVSLDDLESLPGGGLDPEGAVSERQALERLEALIRRLAPLDRQVILLYLEGMNAADIGEVTGLSVSNVATKVYRIKHVLTRGLARGDDHV